MGGGVREADLGLALVLQPSAEIGIHHFGNL